MSTLPIRRRKTPVNLPDETIPRMRMLIENSAPDPERPRLPEEAEQRLANTEVRNAQAYAEIEETNYRLNKLAESIRGDIATLDSDIKKEK